MAIKGKFDLLAIPNYDRTNRDGAATSASPQRGGRSRLSSIV